MPVIPIRVAGRIKPDDNAPSVRAPLQHLHPYYGRFRPCAPHRYSGSSRRLTAWISPLASGATGSCVPYQSLSQGHAAFMPDAGWAVGRHPPNPCSRDRSQIPVLTSIEYVTTRHQRFTRVRLLETYLTEYLPPFPPTLTTRALYPRSLGRFEACPCRPASEGRPPSLIKLHWASRGDPNVPQHTTSSYFTAAPQPFDKHVVPPGALAIHADRDAVLDKHAGEGCRP